MRVSAFASMLGTWQAAAAGPLYRRLAAAIGAAVAAGRVPAGMRLPAERPLAAALAVSRTTVVGAYDLLREEGWVESRRGSGTRVRALAMAPPPPPSPAPEPAGEAKPWAPAMAAKDGRGGVGAGGVDELTRPLRRMDFFRGLVEVSGSRIDFVGAHLAAAQPFVAEEWSGAAAELAPQLGHDGYLGLGLPVLREAVADHLAGAGLPTSAEQILITSGAHQAIGLVAALYLQPGDAVALEDPNYPGALDIFNYARARLVPIPVTADGANLERLREAVLREAARLIYLVPSFHNPTGALMPAAQRWEVARLAAETGTPVLEDLTLNDLDLDVAPPPPIAAAVPGAPVLTIGSLSKLAWAGLRVGWVRADVPVIARLARFKVLSDLGSSVPSQILAARLLRRAAVIRQARRQEVRERRRVLEETLAAALPGWTWRRPAGGLCLWARLPRGNAEELARDALSHGVAILPGPTCSPRDAWEPYLRLPYVLEPAEIREGIARLARAWETYAPAARSRPPAPAPAPVDVLV